MRVERLAVGETIRATRAAIADLRAAERVNDARAVRRLLSEAIKESRAYINDAKGKLGQ